MSKAVLVPLAQSCEELEAVTVIDILRRAELTVVSAGLDTAPVTASRGVILQPDTTLTAALQQHSYDMIVLPGGMPGAKYLGEDPLVCKTLKEMAAAGKYIAAICAAPHVLAKNGLLAGKKATAYPGFLDTGEFPDVTYTGAAVECDGKVITGRGPGTAMDFALTLVQVLCGTTQRDAVEKGLVRD